MPAPERPGFAVGERVRVKRMTPPGHVRTPWFIRGRTGRVVALNGSFGDPEDLAYGGDGRPALPLYRVRFAQHELWPDYAGPAADAVVVDLYETWLEADPELEPAP